MILGRAPPFLRKEFVDGICPKSTWNAVRRRNNHNYKQEQPQRMIISVVLWLTFSQQDHLEVSVGFALKTQLLQDFDKKFIQQENT